MLDTPNTHNFTKYTLEQRQCRDRAHTRSVYGFSLYRIRTGAAQSLPTGHARMQPPTLSPVRFQTPAAASLMNERLSVLVLHACELRNVRVYSPSNGSAGCRSCRRDVASLRFTFFGLYQSI